MPGDIFHPNTINDLLRNYTQSLSEVNDHITLITLASVLPWPAVICSSDCR